MARLSQARGRKRGRFRPRTAVRALQADPFFRPSASIDLVQKMLGLADPGTIAPPTRTAEVLIICQTQFQDLPSLV